jgi:hypothetical protein
MMTQKNLNDKSQTYPQIDILGWSFVKTTSKLKCNNLFKKMTMCKSKRVHCFKLLVLRRPKNFSRHFVISKKNCNPCFIVITVGLKKTGLSEKVLSDFIKFL